MCGARLEEKDPSFPTIVKQSDKDLFITKTFLSTFAGALPPQCGPLATRAMGKRARDEPGGSGRRRPRVDLTHAADASAAAGVPGAPDYDAWNRDAADPEPVDPVQAALAAKARRVQALGPLGEHLAGYGEDDDDEAEDGTDPATDPKTATEPEPASPWTRLVDDKTRHPYFWNRATGKTVWTLAETNSETDDHKAVVLNKRSDGTNEDSSNRDERGTRDMLKRTALLPTDETTNDAFAGLETTRSVKNKNASSAPEPNSELETTLAALTSTTIEVLRREVSRVVARRGVSGGAETAETAETATETETVAFLRSCVPKLKRAIERVFRAEEPISFAVEDADADVVSDARPRAEHARTPQKEAPPGIEPPPPLPDSPPPSPPPPPGAIARPPALRRPPRDGGGDASASASAPSKKENAARKKTEPLLRISRPPPSAVVERWRAAQRQARDDDDDDEDENQAKRREAEVSAWRDRAARGEEPGVAGNANFAPVAGDWRARAAAARLRREREAATAAGDGSGVSISGKREDGKKENENEDGSFVTSAAADAAAAAAGVDVAAASFGLPDGWRAFYDDARRSLYYGNADTGETRWDPPTNDR